jgi:hypothetical protein
VVWERVASPAPSETGEKEREGTVEEMETVERFPEPSSSASLDLSARPLLQKELGLKYLEASGEVRKRVRSPSSFELLNNSLPKGEKIRKR